MTKRTVDPIVLVMCPTWGVNMPPLGLAYLVSYLRARKRTVHAVDLNIELFGRARPEVKEFWREEYLDCWTHRSFFETMGKEISPHIDWSVERILAFGPHTVGFSINQANLLFTIELAHRLKARRPDLLIIFGGPGMYWVDRVRNLPMGIMSADGESMVPMELVDIFVHGDGEETLASALDAVEEGQDLTSVNAITLPVNGRYQTTGPHRPNRFPDDFPLPEFDWTDFNAYRELDLHLDQPARIAPILLSRGCTNNCKFCNDFVMQGKFRLRSPEGTFKEVQHRIFNEGLNRFYFCDLLVNGNLEQLGAFTDLVLRARFAERFGMRWTGQALARGDMSQAYLNDLCRSGCQTLSYGVETLSEKVLLAMRKNITKADILRTLKMSKKAGMETQINLIVGYPGEGEKEFQETLDFLQRYHKYIGRVSSLSMLMITHGSPLGFEMARLNRGQKVDDDWHRKWETKDGTNTYEIRVERHTRLVHVLTQLGLATLRPANYEQKLEDARRVLEVPVASG